MKHTEPEGFLSAAARTVGHAAGKAAKAIGLEEAEASKPKAAKKSETKLKSGKRVSARSKLIAKAATVKKTAAGLGKETAAGDIRYRRIMGKASTAWSQADVDYIEELTSSKKHVAPA